ncbi:hypothetical protein CEXT_505891 [Caerostris extrusa]|uniref:Uncharacterized protein n=1 Tax=Caerostris extrusa TaxID=172846 RepID=A0AAV4YFW9_CAEEX|nr:hypothetical protein CEXT_505891 [Caerostris extrusa]
MKHCCRVLTDILCDTCDYSRRSALFKTTFILTNGSAPSLRDHLPAPHGIWGRVFPMTPDKLRGGLLAFSVAAGRFFQAHKYLLIGQYNKASYCLKYTLADVTLSLQLHH